MGVRAEGILRGCQGLFTPVSLGYPLSVFNKNSTLKTCTFQLLFLESFNMSWIESIGRQEYTVLKIRQNELAVIH